MCVVLVCVHVCGVGVCACVVLVPRANPSVPLQQVPGTYEAGKPVLKIASFAKILSVISSKQRPRKLTVIADDGSPQIFLLKVHHTYEYCYYCCCCCC